MLSSYTCMHMKKSNKMGKVTMRKVATSRKKQDS